MMLYPEVQRKAQEEIDRVIGNDRLPGFEDRQDLPYIDSIVKEVLRWHPLSPMDFQHTSTEDDIYEGYFIPKDAWIIANIWSVVLDSFPRCHPHILRVGGSLTIPKRTMIRWSSSQSVSSASTVETQKWTLTT